MRAGLLGFDHEPELGLGAGPADHHAQGRSVAGLQVAGWRLDRRGQASTGRRSLARMFTRRRGQGWNRQDQRSRGRAAQQGGQGRQGGGHAVAGRAHAIRWSSSI